MSTIELDAEMAHPREACFRTYRDHLSDLVPYLPNVSGIECIEREDAPNANAYLTRIVNVWRAVGSIPRLARPVVTADMLAWHDYALWNEEEWTCRWRIETHFFKERVRCEATNTFVDLGDRCRLSVRGELLLDLQGFPGVGKLVSKRIGGTLEQFVVRLLVPNLVKVCGGVDAYLDAQAKRGA